MYQRFLRNLYKWFERLCGLLLLNHQDSLAFLQKECPEEATLLVKDLLESEEEV